MLGLGVGSENAAFAVQEKTQWLRNPIPKRSTEAPYSLHVTLLPHAGNRRRLTLQRTTYKIGSSPDADIFLHDPFVSAFHAELRLTKTGIYEVVDLASKNGVELNGLAVKQAPLPKCGLLRIGRSKIEWQLQESAAQPRANGSFVAAAEPMLSLLERVFRAAKTDLPILLLGETGTGKDEIARLIHAHSARSSGKMVALNAATMGGGLVDSELFGHRKGAYTGSDSHRLGALTMANRGTLFLDEIGDLPLDTQAKLLRTFESREVKALGADISSHSDFRLITATSQALELLLQQQKFRSDLYYRISGFTFLIPPLRERTKDIVPLAERFLRGTGLVLAPEVATLLCSHAWPGNVRELKAVVQRAICHAQELNLAVIQAEQIEFSPLGGAATPPDDFKVATLATMERELILGALRRNAWSRQITAKELGIARSTLYEKMRRYKIAN